MRTPKKFLKRLLRTKLTGLKIGDSVVVKEGVQDPDFGEEISGWQGRVTKIDVDEDDTPIIDIQWDSLTLRQMPGAAIERSEEDGLDWSLMSLYAHEVEPTQPRDIPEDVEKVIEELSAQYTWAFLGEQGKLVQEVLEGVDRDDELEAFEAWAKYLKKRLRFPFKARVSEVQERSHIQAGDQVKVTGIQSVEDLYGILVHLQIGHRKYVFPLSDLEAVDENSLHYELIDAYAVWFANR